MSVVTIRYVLIPFPPPLPKGELKVSAYIIQLFHTLYIDHTTSSTTHLNLFWIA